MLTEDKTMTLVHADENPTHTLALGHIGQDEFAARFKAEGWDDCDVAALDLRHEYWREIPKWPGHWAKYDGGERRATAVTVMEW